MPLVRRAGAGFTAKLKAAWDVDASITGFGEFAVDEDNGKLRVGDGVRPWSQIPYCLDTTKDLSKFSASIPNAQAAASGAYLGSAGGNFGLTLSDGTNTWTVDTNSGNLRFNKSGVSTPASLSFAGDLTLAGAVTTLRIGTGNATTATAPSAGAGGALPATPAGYVTISIGGTSRQVAYY